MTWAAINTRVQKLNARISYISYIHIHLEDSNRERARVIKRERREGEIFHLLVHFPVWFSNPISELRSG